MTPTYLRCVLVVSQHLAHRENRKKHPRHRRLFASTHTHTWTDGQVDQRLEGGATRRVVFALMLVNFQSNSMPHQPALHAKKKEKTAPVGTRLKKIAATALLLLSLWTLVESVTQATQSEREHCDPCRSLLSKLNIVIRVGVLLS